MCFKYLGPYSEGLIIRIRNSANNPAPCSGSLICTAWPSKSSVRGPPSPTAPPPRRKYRSAGHILAYSSSRHSPYDSPRYSTRHFLDAENREMTFLVFTARSGEAVPVVFLLFTALIYDHQNFGATRSCFLLA